MIGAIARHHGDAHLLRVHLRSYQRAALDDIAVCGTAACGMHEEICDHCGDRRLIANSCRNRHCPHCQNSSRAAWVAARESELLPCNYLHIVFTVPSALGGLFLAFPEAGLKILMQASGETIHGVTADPRFLGATVAMMQVLHTWKMDLGWHPHVHMIVSAGGLTADGTWCASPRYGPNHDIFFAPVAVVRATFQKRIFHLLRAAYDTGAFSGLTNTFWPHLASRVAFNKWLTRSTRKTWNMHIEPPFGSVETALRYLGRYINRCAIAPSRIASYDRGLWATAHRRTGLQRAREALQELLPASPQPELSQTSAEKDNDKQQPSQGTQTCRACGKGSYRLVPASLHQRTRVERQHALAALRARQREPPTNSGTPPKSVRPSHSQDQVA